MQHVHLFFGMLCYRRPKGFARACSRRASRGGFGIIRRISKNHPVDLRGGARAVNVAELARVRKWVPFRLDGPNCCERKIQPFICPFSIARCALK